MDFVRIVRTKSGGEKPLFIVGKNVSKKATERNKIKRRIKSVVNAFFAKNKTRNVKVIALRGCAVVSYRKLKEEIERKLERLEIHE